MSDAPSDSKSHLDERRSQGSRSQGRTLAVIHLYPKRENLQGMENYEVGTPLVTYQRLCDTELLALSYVFETLVQHDLLFPRPRDALSEARYQECCSRLKEADSADHIASIMHSYFEQDATSGPPFWEYELH